MYSHHALVLRGLQSLWQEFIVLLIVVEILDEYRFEHGLLPTVVKVFDDHLRCAIPELVRSGRIVLASHLVRMNSRTRRNCLLEHSTFSAGVSPNRALP